MGLAEAGKDREQFKVEINPAVENSKLRVVCSGFKHDPLQLGLQAAISKKDYTSAKRLLSKLKACIALCPGRMDRVVTFPY